MALNWTNLSGYKAAFPVSVDTGKVTGTLTDFTVPIREGNFPSGFNWSLFTQADCSEARVALEDGTILKFSLGAASKAGNTFLGHVKVPSYAVGSKVYLVVGHPTNGAMSSADQRAAFAAYRSVYLMDEASGNLVDATGAYGATVSGTPTYGQAGKVGTSIYFGGAPYATTASQAKPTTVGSILGWVNLKNYKAWQSMWTQDGYSFRLLASGAGNGVVRFYWNGNAQGTTGYLEGTTSLGYNTWYHLAGVMDGSYKRVYQAGAEEANVATSTTQSGSAVGTVASYGGTTHPIDGYLDWLAVSYTALSAGWIAAHYNATATATGPWAAAGAIEHNSTIAVPSYYYRRRRT